MADSVFSSMSDEELVRVIRSGESAAMDELASRFFGIKRSGVGYLESDDIAQESLFGFLSAVRSFDETRGVPFKAFAVKCMKNKAASAVDGVGEEIPVAPDDSVLIPDGIGCDPLDSVITAEQLAGVLGACEVTLSALEKSVVFCHTGGMSYKEIGARLGVSEKTVNNALQRARKKLKSVFD